MIADSEALSQLLVFAAATVGSASPPKLQSAAVAVPTAFVSLGVLATFILQTDLFLL